MQYVKLALEQTFYALKNIINNFSLNNSQQEKLDAEDSGGSWEKGEGEHFIAKAAFPFTASQEGELNLTAGQLIVVAPQVISDDS